MLTRLDKAVARQTASLKATAGVAVMYVRTSSGGEQIAIAKAVQTHSQFERTDDEGIVTEIEVDDFLIEAVDLVLAGSGGVQVEPAEHDRIEVDRGNHTLTYQVLPPAGDEPAWRYTDPNRSRLRIHTKLIVDVDGGAS